MRKIRTYHEVEGDAGASLVEQVVAQGDRLHERLAKVRALIVVASGKGGVGKSAVTANLAAALAAAGHSVGAVDADLNGPSLARMLGVVGQSLTDLAGGARPPRGAAGVKVVSMELFQEGADAPLRWKEPAEGGPIWQSSLETSALREFLSDIEWGELDFLLVDVPPGTDKIGRVLHLVPRVDQLLLVTTPSEMARSVVARSARFVREAGVENVALISNMTDHLCPDCGRLSPLYTDDGARRLAEETGLEVWCRLPFDPQLATSTDRGEPIVLAEPDSVTSQKIRALAKRVAEEAGS